MIAIALLVALSMQGIAFADETDPPEQPPENYSEISRICSDIGCYVTYCSPDMGCFTTFLPRDLFPPRKEEP